MMVGQAVNRETPFSASTIDYAQLFVFSAAGFTPSLMPVSLRN